MKMFETGFHTFPQPARLRVHVSATDLQPSIKDFEDINSKIVDAKIGSSLFYTLIIVYHIVYSIAADRS
jgi:hypothetical protein